MELSKGYKQTEVGVIPEDWNSVPLGEVCFPSKTRVNPLATLVNYKCVELEHISQRTGMLLGHADSNKLLSHKSIFEKGDVLLGKLRPYLRKFLFANFSGLCTTEIWVLKSKPNIHNRFLYYIVQSDKIIEAANLSTGTKMPRAEWKTVSETLIELPNIKEQTAIANALSDMDALIGSLEQLIEKKKAIKLGAMQELLKPKDGWVTKKLGDYGRTYGGLTGKSKQDFSDGNCSYIPFMNIMSNPIIDTQYFDRVKIFVGEKQNSAKKGDLFFNGSSETPEEVGMCSVLSEEIPNLYLNSFCFGFRFHENVEVNGLFLAYYFRSTFGRKLIFSLAQGATRYNLSKTNLLKLELPLPGIEDQNEITRVILDMDCEINSLKLKLKKTIQEKQAMMQVLLTGKIRLV